MRGLTMAAALAAAAVSADDEQRRPCGPGSGHSVLRLLFPQAFLGADFRPACRAHDACYVVPGANKDQCDEAFHQAMLQACDHSMTPGLCRAMANTMHTAVRGRASVRIFLRYQPH